MTTISAHNPGLEPPVRGDSRSSRPAGLVRVAAVLALAAALGGLIVDGVYTGPASTAEILRGYDLVTAALVVPSLIVSTSYARRGSLLGRLFTAGLLADLVYSYAFYVFGTGFNDLFLLHLAVFSTSVTALMLTLAGFDVHVVAERFRPMRHVWPVGVSLGVLAVALGGMWISAGVVNALTGTVPVGSGLVETAGMIHLALALDLALQVPLYAAAAVLVWRRIGWGYVLAFVAVVSGVPEQISYLVSMPLQAGAGVPGAAWSDPLEPVILALYLIAFLVLLLGSRPRPSSGLGSAASGGRTERHGQH